MARVVGGLVLGLLLVAGIVWATLGETQVECEVCMAFGGGTACRTGSAADRDGAVRGATSAACAVLSAGVTAGMACDRTPPRSVECR